MRTGFPTRNGNGRETGETHLRPSETKGNRSTVIALGAALMMAAPVGGAVAATSLVQGGDPFLVAQLDPVPPLPVRKPQGGPDTATGPDAAITSTAPAPPALSASPAPKAPPARLPGGITVPDAPRLDIPMAPPAPSTEIVTEGAIRAPSSAVIPPIPTPPAEPSGVEAAPAPPPMLATTRDDPALAATGPRRDAAPVEGDAFTIAFEPDSADLPETGTTLLAGIAARLARDENTRLQLRAYAQGSRDTPGEARRLSLNRALVVRAFLVDQGIRGTRIDVRALGATAPDVPVDGNAGQSGSSADRVDIVVN